jgi:hypothetical protein
MAVRSLSFKENEKDLTDYFDNNGKSDIVKEAMKFYIKNKDKIIINGLGELIPLIGNNQPTKQVSNSINKLIR